MQNTGQLPQVANLPANLCRLDLGRPADSGLGQRGLCFCGGLGESRSDHCKPSCRLWCASTGSGSFLTGGNLLRHLQSGILSLLITDWLQL